MTEVENQTLNLLKNLIENREKIYNKIEEAKEKLIPIVNIINILGNTYYEVSNSSLLYNILKIKFKYDKYDNKEINFAKDFSEYIIKEKLGNDSVNINSSNISVYSEEHPSIESKRRMDLFIQSDNFEIIIENKIGAGDQPNQLQNYYSNRINENKIIKDNIFVVYLTRYGNKPSEFSINKVLMKKLEKENKIYYLSHDDMSNWIEDKILNNKEYEFLKEKEFQLIYSALIQIAYNEKIISKETEENKMEIDEIKKYVDFDLLLKGANNLDKKVNELNKSIELFENAKKLIADKKREIILENESVKNNIKYSVDVSNYIKEKGITAIICNEEQIRQRISSEADYRNIIIPITSIWYHNYIVLGQDISGLSIWINGTNRNFINKVKEKDIKNKIVEILNGYDEEGEGGDWDCIYYKYIDINKYELKDDIAKDIADKIIKLYEFLKDNINFDNA